MINDTFANRLYKALTIRKMKQTELANITGIDKSLISNYLKGNYEAKQNNVYLLAQALHVSEAWLMGYNVSMEVVNNSTPSSAVVLIYGTIPAGIPVECIEDILDTEEISAEMLKGGKQYFGLKIKGDSMYPEYLDGDTIILEKVDNCESGQDCVVMVNGNDGTFKRVIKSENGIILQPLNPTYAPLTYSNEQIVNMPVKILGVVRELRRKK